MTDEVSRRSFIKTTLTALIASGGAASAAEPKLDNSRPTKNLDAIFSNEAYKGITTQTSEALDAAKLKGKVTLFVTGFEGCPVCANIAKTLVATQKKLNDAGIEHQIVVMSIKPETDREDLKAYVERYKAAGLEVEHGKLMLLMAPSNKIASDIHTENFAMRNINDAGNHTLKIYVYGADGKNIGAAFASEEAKKDTVANATLNSITAAQGHNR